MKSECLISLCDFTGNAVAPWIDAGFRAVLVDEKHPDGWTHDGNPQTIGCDVRNPLLKSGLGFKPRFVFAFPPCTDLAVSGARWFKEKGLMALSDAIGIVAACVKICERSGAPWCLENPISTLSTYWRQPDYTFDPCEYAGYLEDPSTEAYTKRTCLWTGGGLRYARTQASRSSSRLIHAQTSAECRSCGHSQPDPEGLGARRI